MEMNKIYLGDAYKLIKELPDKSVDGIYTDIPYLIEKHGYGKSKLADRMTRRDDELKGRKDKVAKRMEELKQKMENAKTDSEYEQFRVQRNALHNQLNLLTNQDITSGIDWSILDEFVRVCKHIYIYIWCSKEQVPYLLDYFVTKKGCRFNILVWCKTNSVPCTNNSWLPNLEYCLVFKEKGAPKYNDGYELKSKWFMSSCNKYDKDKYKHPTIKDIRQVEQHLKHSFNKGDIVLDPFAGSGTTLLACKHLGINYIGYEIDELYYKICTDRVENGIDQNGNMNLFDI